MCTKTPMKCTQVGDNVNVSVFSARMIRTAAVDAARGTPASAVSGQSLDAASLFMLILTYMSLTFH